MHRLFIEFISMPPEVIGGRFTGRAARFVGSEIRRAYEGTGARRSPYRAIAVCSRVARVRETALRHRPPNDRATLHCMVGAERLPPLSRERGDLFSRNIVGHRIMEPALHQTRRPAQLICRPIRLCPPDEAIFLPIASTSGFADPSQMESRCEHPPRVRGGAWPSCACGGIFSYDPRFIVSPWYARKISHC